MKFVEIKEKSKSELSEMLKELKGALSRLNFELSNNTLKNPSQVKKTKKDIARILTVLNTNK